MLRGLESPVAISWAFHPLATTGGEYDGVRTVAHAVEDWPVVSVVVVVVVGKLVVVVLVCASAVW
jgi:hypothetical protein